jgi:hypothetical protein
VIAFGVSLGPATSGFSVEEVAVAAAVAGAVAGFGGAGSSAAHELRQKSPAQSETIVINRVFPGVNAPPLYRPINFLQVNVNVFIT